MNVTRHFGCGFCASDARAVGAQIVASDDLHFGTPCALHAPWQTKCMASSCLEFTAEQFAAFRAKQGNPPGSPLTTDATTLELLDRLTGGKPDGRVTSVAAQLIASWSANGQITPALLRRSVEVARDLLTLTEGW